MKKIIIFLVTFLCTIPFFANEITKVSVLPDYSTYSMDVKSYGNTTWEALYAADDPEWHSQAIIFLNKYVDNQYQETLELLIDGYYTYEMGENASHYKFLTINLLSENDMCLVVYEVYSNCKIHMFRITDGNIVCYKGYDLSKYGSYESTTSYFDGKKSIYFAFEASDTFGKSKWDTWICEFNTDCEMTGIHKIYTLKSDVPSSIFTTDDYIYYKISTTLGNNYGYIILQMNKNYEVLNTYYFGYKYCEIGYADFYTNGSDIYVNFTKTATPKNDSFIAKYTQDLQLVWCKQIICEDNVYLLSDVKIYKDKVRFYTTNLKYIGQDTMNDNKFTFTSNPVYIDFPLDGQIIDSKKSKDFTKLSIHKYNFSDDKIFASGYRNISTNGMQKLAYNFSMTMDEPVDSDEFKIVDSSIDLSNPEVKDDVSAPEIFIESVEIIPFSRTYSLNVKKLDFVSTTIFDEEVIETIPKFPFSER